MGQVARQTAEQAGVGVNVLLDKLVRAADGRKSFPAQCLSAGCAAAACLRWLATHWSNSSALCCLESDAGTSPGKVLPVSHFVAGLAFVVRIGAVAEEQGHHPDVTLTWGKVDVRIYTHMIDGLSENDFILAAKIDHLYFARHQT